MTKIDANKLLDITTEMLFDRPRGIYIRRKTFGHGKVWSVRNEVGEYLNKNLEFEPSAGQKNSTEFKSRTEFEFDVAYQLASAYIGKTVRIEKEFNVSSFTVRKPGTSPSKVSNFDIYTNDDE